MRRFHDALVSAASLMSLQHSRGLERLAVVEVQPAARSSARSPSDSSKRALRRLDRVARGAEGREGPSGLCIARVLDGWWRHIVLSRAAGCAAARRRARR